MSTTNKDIEDQSPVAVATSMPNTTVVTSTTVPSSSVVQQTSDVPMYKQQKLGQRCCGCCCDYRRACLVVGILFAIFNSINLILAIIGTAVPGTVSNVNDDQAQELINDRGIYAIIISAIGLAFSVLAILGALWFNIYLLAVNVVWFIVAFAVQMWANAVTVQRINDLPSNTTTYSVSLGSYIVGALITALWIYPFIGLILEIKKGIMSKETYPREEYSCCCTPHKH